MRVSRLVGVFSRAANAGDSLHSQIGVLHLCEVVGGELTLSHEGLDLRYWALDEVPQWFANHERMAHVAYELWASKSITPVSE